MRRNEFIAALGAAGLLAATGRALAQDAPAGPQVRITSAFPTGSGPDTVARLLADKLGARWRKPVVVEPKPGAAGVVAVNAVKGAAATGAELVVLDVGTLAINPSLFKSLSYDAERDFVPVAMLYKTPLFVAVAAASPVRSVKELLELAAKDGHLTYGSNAVGSPLHLAAAQLGHAAGVHMVHVPFKETSQLYAAVATGEVGWAYGTLATAGPLLRSGKLRFLAVGDAVRSEALPEVPTLQEAGGPKGVTAIAWVALMAPRGTPAALAEGINKAVNEAMAQPDMKERLAGFGVATMPGPPRAVAERMREDRARYAEIIRRAGISPE